MKLDNPNELVLVLAGSFRARCVDALHARFGRLDELEQATHVLDGRKVDDFTQFIAGPTVTRMMAQMGADVIKVEIAPDGDRTRVLPFYRDHRSGYFVQQNLGKRSLCLDVKNPAALAIFKELVAKVDVVVENFAPGVIARMGLDYETVRALNPRVVMRSVSTFGQQGPLAHLPGYDFIAQAYSGITYMIGETDGPPEFPTAALGDVSTGVHAALAVVAALLHRERTGAGQYLDIALLDAYFHCHHTAIQMYSLSGGAIKPGRTGHHLSYAAPLGCSKGASATSSSSRASSISSRSCATRWAARVSERRSLQD